MEACGSADRTGLRRQWGCITGGPGGWAASAPRPSAVQGEGVPLGASAHFQCSCNNGKGCLGRSQAEHFFLSCWRLKFSSHNSDKRTCAWNSTICTFYRHHPPTCQSHTNLVKSHICSRQPVLEHVQNLQGGARTGHRTLSPSPTLRGRPASVFPQVGGSGLQSVCLLDLGGWAGTTVHSCLIAVWKTEKTRPRLARSCDWAGRRGCFHSGWPASSEFWKH